MRPGSVVGAWVAGLLIAAAAVAFGPERLFFSVMEMVASLGDALERIGAVFGARALQTARGLAIGLFVTFLVLCGLARRQGRPAGTAFLVVGVLWLALASSAEGDPGRWGMAMVLALVGSLAMTRRVLDRSWGDR